MTRCYIVAEAGINHNGDLNIALELVSVAAQCGADAIKFQMFDATLLASAAANKAAYQLSGASDDEPQIDMLHRHVLSRNDFVLIHEYAQGIGIDFTASPFDFKSADFLCELGVPFIKISSGELTNMPLLYHVGRKNVPIVMSTGMSDEDCIWNAIDAIGNNRLRLLHCVSSYPTQPSDANLSAMQTLRDVFNYDVGYSDHTVGIAIPVAAATLGACIVEKHFTLDKNQCGPDHKISADPAELHAMVEAIRTVESAIGDGRLDVILAERDTMVSARRSLAISRDMHAGDVISAGDICMLRPATGIQYDHIDDVIGMKLSVAVEANSILQWDMLCAK